MVVKFIESSYDSLKDKLKNPFYGTLFVVWVIRNREFIYNVFFNENVTSDERLELIRAHFLNWDSLLSFIGTIIISLGLMILIYASLNLSRLIVEASERKLKPEIQKIFNKTSIVSREHFIDLEKERDYFQKKYSDERIEKTRIQRELDQLLEQGLNSNIQNEQSKENKKATEENPMKTNDDSQNKAKIIIDRWKKLRPTYFEDFKTLMKLKSDQLRTHVVESAMKDIASVREFKDKGIIETIVYNNFQYFNFTEFGDEIQYYVSNLLKEKK